MPAEAGYPHFGSRQIPEYFISRSNLLLHWPIQGWRALLSAAAALAPDQP